MSAPGSPSSVRGQQDTSKLRKACNACNSAKVRCSGERDGCSRCQASYLECIYTTSRVGKNPGLRAKKVRPAEEPVSPSRTKRHPAAVQRPAVSGRSLARRGSEVAPDHGLEDWSSEPYLNEGLLLGPMDDVFDVDFNIPTTSASAAQRHHPHHPHHHHRPPSLALSSPYPRSTASSSLLASSRVSTSDLDSYDEPASSITSVTDDAAPGRRGRPMSSSSSSYMVSPTTRWHQQATAAASTPPPPPPPMLHSQTQNDSECVVACCTIISQLEAYIEAKVEVLDIALACVRKAVGQLTEVMNRGIGSRYCHMLLGVSIYQIVYILERACKLFLDQAHSDAASGGAAAGELAGSHSGSVLGRRSSLSSMGGILTGLSFGGVGLDPGEQRAFQARVVLKVVRQVSTISNHVIALAAREAPAANVQACHVDLIQRLEAFELQLVRVQNA